MFFKGSRYEKVPSAVHADASGRVIRYKTVRFIAAATPTTVHRVVAGERLDLLAHKFYRDSERFWRICDANLATRPEELIEPGAFIGIPPSEG